MGALQPRSFSSLPCLLGPCSINAVMRSQALTAADSIFLLDIAYGSVKKLAAYVAGVTHASVVTAHMPSSVLVSDDAIVDAVAAALPSNARLAVIDHVTSNTGFVLPVQRLVQLFHARGVEVLVDGAHAVGMLDLDLTALGADYYVRCGQMVVVLVLMSMVVVLMWGFGCEVEVEEVVVSDIPILSFSVWLWMQQSTQVVLWLQRHRDFVCTS